MWSKMLWILPFVFIRTMELGIVQLAKGQGTRLSILRSILNEAIDYRAGRDDVDAISHVLDSKPKAIQDLWLEEARYDDEWRLTSLFPLCGSTYLTSLVARLALKSPPNALRTIRSSSKP